MHKRSRLALMKNKIYLYDICNFTYIIMSHCMYAPNECYGTDKNVHKN